MRKLRPTAEKREVNAAFAALFSRAKKKSTRRKLRHIRVIERETNWLVTHGVDLTESGAPIA